MSLYCEKSPRKPPKKVGGRPCIARLVGQHGHWPGHQIGLKARESVALLAFAMGYIPGCDMMRGEMLCCGQLPVELWSVPGYRVHLLRALESGHHQASATRCYLERPKPLTTHAEPSQQGISSLTAPKVHQVYIIVDLVAPNYKDTATPSQPC